MYLPRVHTVIGNYFILISKKHMKNPPNAFTMVEVLIVGVIVAVLAITATIIYQGYITNTRQKTVTNLAETAAAAANSYFRRTGAHPNLANLQLHLPDPARYNVTINTGDSTVIITDNEHSLADTAHY